MRSRRSEAFTLIEIMIAVTIIGMLAAISIPAFARARKTSQRSACISNLRQLSGAKQQWAIENFEPVTAAPTPVELDPYIKGGTAAVTCPADSTKSFATSYGINDVATEPVCNIFPVEHVSK